jgi:hypothetical protein
MDRASLLEQLEQSKIRVADGEEFIVQQRSLIGELEIAHRGTKEAHKFMRTLEELLATHIARQVRLEQELATANSE